MILRIILDGFQSSLMFASTNIACYFKTIHDFSMRILDYEISEGCPRLFY